MGSRTAQSNCPFCGRASARVWGRQGSHDIFECEGCGVSFFPRPLDTPADYDGYYPYLEHFDHARFEWELGVRRAKYQKQLTVVRSFHPSARRLLDVGAGPGYFCKVAREAGWDALGVETSRAAVAAGARELGVEYVALADVPAGSRDAVTCHHVLEHVEEPRGFLQGLHATLGPGGILVVHVPHREPMTFWLRNLPARSRGRPRRRSQLYHPEHVSGFDERSLRRAIELHGFECLSSRTVSMWSPFYDPFFLRNYFVRADGEPVDRVDYVGLGKRFVRSVGENVGALVGRGDWVVAHFRKV